MLNLHEALASSAVRGTSVSDLNDEDADINGNDATDILGATVLARNCSEWEACNREHA